ncbi:DUF4295 domain-containing protein [Blattabacterium cuenoti]|uniref:DUF4295 domain-containing protein n=1 Tax=Blattabacterium cuenoti TaxID=1653831 RepID=UPI00163C72BC|nr:DUF4295 domain-containing protein [Blattabacterium cuenoti]
MISKKKLEKNQKKEESNKMVLAIKMFKRKKKHDNTYSYKFEKKIISEKEVKKFFLEE